LGKNVYEYNLQGSSTNPQKGTLGIKFIHLASGGMISYPGNQLANEYISDNAYATAIFYDIINNDNEPVNILGPYGRVWGSIDYREANNCIPILETDYGSINQWQYNGEYGIDCNRANHMNKISHFGIDVGAMAYFNVPGGSYSIKNRIEAVIHSNVTEDVDNIPIGFRLDGKTNWSDPYGNLTNSYHCTLTRILMGGTISGSRIVNNLYLT
jgi:hypothetical protein